MNKLLLTLPLLSSLSAWAHEGHGLEGSHAHATDTLGFVMAIVAIAAMIWTGRQ